MRRILWTVGAAGLVAGPLLVAGTITGTAAAADLAACLSAPTRDCLTVVAIERAAAVSSNTDRSSLRAALAAEQARDGAIDAARATFARAVADAATGGDAGVDPGRRVDTLMTVARLQAQSGQEGDARATLAQAAAFALEAAPAAGGRGAAEWSNRLRVLADRQLEFGDRDGARASLAAAAEVAAVIEDPFRRGTELMMTAARQAGRAEDATAGLATFAAAKEAAAPDASDPLTAPIMLLSIGQAELQVGLRDAGIETLRDAQAAAANLTPPSDRARLEAQIALTLLAAPEG